MAFQSPWVSGSGGSPWGFATTSTNKKEHHSLLGNLIRGPGHFIDHLAVDIKNAAFGLPSGLVALGKHPIRGIEDLGKSTWHDWSPFIKGYFHEQTGILLALTGQEHAAGHQFRTAGHDFATFGKQFYAHPLAPLLDIAAVFTGGAGAAAKATNLLTKTEFATALASEEGAAVARGFVKTGKMAHLSPKYGSPDWVDAVKAGGGIDVPAVHARLSRRAQFGRPQSIALHGRGEASGAVLYKNLPSNPWTRQQVQFRRALGHKLADAMPKWFGETSPIRDLTPEGEFGRLAAKNFANHSAARNSVLAGQLQIFKMLDAGHALVNDPYQTAQILHEHARPQLETHSTVFKTDANTIFKYDAKGNPTHIKPPPGWSIVKVDPGVPQSLFKNNTAAEFHTYTKDKFGALNASARSTKLGEAYRDAQGNFRIVRSKGIQAYGDEFHASGKFVEMLVKRPTNVWKRLVLAPAPRYFVNNAVGNMFMFLMTSNVHAARALAEGYKNLFGDGLAAQHLSKADRLIERHLGQGYDAMERHWGQTYKQGTAAEQVASISKEGVPHGKFRTATGKLSKGFLPVTHKVAERSLRRSVSYGFLRAQPEVRALMKSGHTFDHAVDMLGADASFNIRVTEAVNDVLGDYHHLSKIEQQIRNFVPFYTWLRAISRHTGKLVENHPTRAVGLTYAGQLGIEKTKEMLGDMPDFLKGAMPLELLGFHHNPNTRAGILTTQGLNPYASIPQAIDAVRMITTGGVPQGEAMASILGPLPVGVIEATTGQSLLSGKKLGHLPGGLLANVGISQFMETPLPRVFTQARQGTVTEHHGRATLYKQDMRSALAALLGVPVKNMDINTAYNLALAERGEKKPKKGRYKSPFVAPEGSFRSPWTKTTI